MPKFATCFQVAFEMKRIAMRDSVSSDSKAGQETAHLLKLSRQMRRRCLWNCVKYFVWAILTLLLLLLFCIFNLRCSFSNAPLLSKNLAIGILLVRIAMSSGEKSCSLRLKGQNIKYMKIYEIDFIQIFIKYYFLCFCIWSFGIIIHINFLRRISMWKYLNKIFSSSGCKNLSRNTYQFTSTFWLMTR